MISTTAVPELGRLLGRLVGPEAPSPAAISLDAARLALLSRLFTAAGAARQALATGDEAAARACLRLEVWLDAWRALSVEVTAVVTAAARTRLTAAAATVRLPAARAGRPIHDDAEAALIRHRLEAAGLPLERVPPPEHAADWGDAVRVAALAVDASWERLVAVVTEEMTRVADREQELLAWQRPRLARWVLTAGVLVLAMLLGLWGGGYLTPPPPNLPWGAP